VALGRQVPVLVTNKVTGKGIAGADIKVLNTEAKTDKTGKATIVLPTDAATQKGTITLSGYNTLSITVQVTDQAVPANNFGLTPAGKLYFLSNLSGKIDVVKTNLDGSERQTVLAATGKEDKYNTALLASRDWKYLALLSNRDGGTHPKIFLIDTSSDKVTTMDEGSADFSLVGWSEDTFVYQVNRNLQSWQPKGQALKSYNATSGKLTLLDETAGEGTSSSDYANSNFNNVYILENEVVYVKNWYGSLYPNKLDGKSVDMVSIKPDGTNKKTIKSFAVPAGTQYNYYVGMVLYQPYGVYVQVPTGSSSTYYVYTDGNLTQKNDITDTIYNQVYPTFLISPSDKQTNWSDERDGKNVLFTGDDKAQGPKQIASLSEYTPYGWFSDTYVLVSKNASELYIMPADGSTPPFKITDYYKPALTFRGYGGGYGGL
jgi:hypothetical protein